MVKTLLELKKRGLPFSLLFVLSCAASGPVPQQLAANEGQPDWPREFEARDSRIVVYEPQLETFRGGRMTSRAAVSVTRPDAAEPVFGGIWMDTVLTIDPQTKVATPEIVRITEVRFPNLGADEAARLRQDLAEEIPRWNLSYSVDELHAQLRLIEERRAAAEGLKADVPRILFRIEPAVLLEIQGHPVWRKSANAAYERLENSAAFVVRNTETGTCYLQIAPFWWTSTDPVGAWQAANDVPEAVAELWKNEPQPQLPSDDAPRRPDVIPATVPTELVWTDGAPQYAPVAGTNLLYVRNTDSDVFLDIQTQFTYALFSGRWFRRPPTKEEWEFVASDRLPNDFSRIPAGSEKHHVLACVAGTPQAREAVKNTEIPQTEAVKPGPAPEMQTAYDGEPQFTQEPVAGVEVAVNSPYSIFRVENRYYWCYDGIWYDAAYSVGPWFVCSFVPRPIYRIPPSSPHYYVTYCHVFGWNSSAVYVGYYPGYLGCYSWRGSVVFGTGWYYRPWVGTRCYTRPVTWGVHARYNPRSCDWSIRGSYVSNYRRSPGGRAPGVHAGVGGAWGGGHSNGGAGSYRSPSLQPHPSARDARPNLYVRQPDRRAPSPRIPKTQPHPEERDGRSGRKPQPPNERREVPKTQPHPEERDPRNGQKSQPPGERREIPKTQPHPENEKEQPRKGPPVEKREAPRDVPKKTPPPAEREERRTPPPVEKREVPKKQPPPVEREQPRNEKRDLPPPPRTPPPAEKEERRAPPPPPREVPKRQPPPTEREAPKSPPPQERREAPKSPPPPPPPRERREAPKSPPPPRENREAQRNPPPQRREPQKSPPGQQQQDRRR